MTRFRCDRYRCWSCCTRQDGLGNDFTGVRFGDASTQSQEAKKCESSREVAGFDDIASFQMSRRHYGMAGLPT
jgi:hypothetical protein